MAHPAPTYCNKTVNKPLCKPCFLLGKTKSSEELLEYVNYTEPRRG